MIDHIQNRELIIKTIKEELVGPFPQGDELDTNKPINFDKDDNWYGPWRQKGTGEEILLRDTPIKRYGIGVLFPYGISSDTNIIDSGPDVVGLIGQFQTNEDTISEKTDESAKTNESLESAREKISRLRGEAGQNDIDLSLANSFNPCSMGISFLAEIPNQEKLIVKVTGGRYQKLPVQHGNSSFFWWVRSPVTVRAEFETSSLVTANKTLLEPIKIDADNVEGLDLHIELFSRPFTQGKRLITVCLINRTKADSQNENSLFQSHFKVTFSSIDSNKYILPYPGSKIKKEQLSEEELSLTLLYRNRQTFGIGHGCSADWDSDTTIGRAAWISAECLPIIETPSMTPDISDKENIEIKVPMALLAGLIEGEDGFLTLERIIDLYKEWISEKEKEVEKINPELQRIAKIHLQRTRICAKRMEEGLGYIKNDRKAKFAFQLANYAILLQQIQSRNEPRTVSFDSKLNRIIFSEEYKQHNPLDQTSSRGNWRAFQIAFILMCLKSTVDGRALDRDTVELIWFPTGGGKTEAYLGLAAFAIFMRRLKNQEDCGVDVLMRYTLRLLTAQQFQRSSRLLCAMEILRKENLDLLGHTPFSIGLWVGGANTPNTRKEAIRILNGLRKGDRDVENQFVLDRCPWCGAQIGPIEYDKKTPKVAPKVIGYIQEGDRVVLKCSDNKCPFSTGLPVFVVDEDIYEFKPSLVIGTVDKFAMLAWRSDTRSLFGLGRDGIRVFTPPSLIIQDELHLISGPLGSMVGLYEAVIEELCTDRREEPAVKPKIICSTATIRRYEDQIRSLYARTSVVLFPPPGLEEGDSFFGRYARNLDGSLKPGRKYVGVNAPGLGSMQTVQVRTFTSLLQSPLGLPENERDPWWTLLLFFNSLRELGTTLSLLQSDIPDYQQVFLNRLSKTNRNKRFFWEIKELTGRASSGDIPKSISALEVRYPNQTKRPVDVCLASNILEVGIDIDRLSLMVIVGQPKTTSQYIQVSGRVGRSWWIRPGLVITIYGASKPRDRSHFEKFRSYHEKLYSQVEPTSVTPFSPPALDRALHAILAAFVQQLGNEKLRKSPYPYPEGMIDQLRDILLPRIQTIDPEEVDNFKKIFDKRSREWKDRQHTIWKTDNSSDDIGLLRVAGAYATKEQEELSWPTQQSLRSVDAECITEIVLPYSMVEGEGDDAE